MLGQHVRLEPRSKLGKERIKRDGATGWSVVKVSETVLFAPGHRGPWLFISKGEEKTSRWVHATSDKDFGVEAMAAAKFAYRVKG